MNRQFAAPSVAAAALLLACSSADDSGAVDEGAFQGPASTLGELTFETEVHAPTVDEARDLLNAQLYWLVGPFHKLGGDPRLTWMKSTELRAETISTPNGAEGVVHFRVVMPVAWPKEVRAPESYSLVLPKRVDGESQSAFFTKYEHTCFNANAHDIDSGNAWYDFAPTRSGCQLDEADLVRPTATFRTVQPNTVGTYPDYERIWSDKKFRVTAVFGRDEPTSVTDDDLGVKDYRKFVDAFKSDASFQNVRFKEEEFQDRGTKSKQATLDADLAGGRSVHVAVFLLAKPSWSGKAFDVRYNRETEDADYVAFAGHAGLGGNVQKLQALGKFKPGKYQVYVYDGCDTFAYIDKQLFDKKRAANGAQNDPQGTRDLDVVLNALPTPWTSGDPNVLKLARALMKDERPSSYEAILGLFPFESAPVVVGDEDNKWQPPTR